MENIIVLAILIAVFVSIILIIGYLGSLVADKSHAFPGWEYADNSHLHGGERAKSKLYFYGRKDSIMTNAEWQFYERLVKIAAGRYMVFPQIHLSSLMRNETKGKYYKLAFQRINRRSVDYVLCDIETHEPVYAVELDDSSHDSAKRQARDALVQEMLDDIQLPLVRFRNVNQLRDADIANKFREANIKQVS